jgi:hypothetical protein
LTVDGQPVPQVELLRRVDPQGNAMVWAINHEPTAVAGRLEGAALVDAAAIANLEAGQPVALEKGSCRLTLAPGETVVLAIGSAAFVEDRLVAQKRVPVTIPPMP